MNNKAPYPQQAAYPPQQGSSPLYPPAMAGQQAPPYSDAPPSYSEIYQPRYMHPQQAGTVPQMPSTYPGAQMFMHMPQSVPMAQMGHNVPIAYYPMGHLYPPGSTVLVEGGYDAGARFGAGSSPSIPPVPPGHLPNAAQLAAMQNASVMMSQRKGNFFMGGSSGGYSIW
ncbi:DAZ-associated protein 2-like [Huso huso]|uniref:DAZ-associated protein 2 n=1 Tax=Huso huso TaxID=61971 RepID=A0ABR0YFJ1_HUSHU